MKKYEQIILKFKIADLKSDEKLLEVQQELSRRGAAGFKIISTLIHSTEVTNNSFRYLFCIMEREYNDFVKPGFDLSSDDDGW